MVSEARVKFPPKMHHYVKLTIEFTCEAEDLAVNEILEEMRGIGMANITAVDAFSSEKEMYELDK